MEKLDAVLRKSVSKRRPTILYKLGKLNFGNFWGIIPIEPIFLYVDHDDISHHPAFTATDLDHYSDSSEPGKCAVSTPQIQ